MTMIATPIGKSPRKAPVAPTRPRENAGVTTFHQANIGGEIVNYTVTLAKDPTYMPPIDERDIPTEAEFEEGLQAIRRFNQERHLMACATADLIEQNPELALKNARAHIKKFRNKFVDFQRWYRSWDRILTEWTPQEICAYLRNEKYVDSGLRLSAPVFGELSDAAIAKVIETVYGKTA